MGVKFRLVQEIPPGASIGPYGELVAPFEPADFVQPLPDGRRLAVTSRGRGKNAKIVDPDGAVLAEASLGDAVNRVLTTPSGQVWIGYFDEGVFGGAPPACFGLVRFTPDLTVDWTFPEGTISDCYAMNVDGETAWICPYADFPIIRVQRGKIREWANPVHGGHGLLVRGSRVALVGSYGAPNRLTVGHLRDEFHVTAVHEMTFPQGSYQVVCRGADLHLLSETHWYTLNLDDVSE